MSILVTGGAGYIGSHTVAELVAHGEDVIVLDNLGTGHRAAVVDAELVEADIRDTETVRAVLKKHRIETVVHFAAFSLVGESVQQPLKYYENNVHGTQMLLQAMAEENVKNIVFSSTAAVYGEPKRTPIEETDPTVPTNPYGETKLAIERMFAWCSGAFGLNAISLRYFNAAGAHPTLSIGEDHNPESHLVPIVLQTALGQREAVQVFGDDYDTADGTCVRDYVHVMDLASAHRLAVLRLRQHAESGQSLGVDAFNLGNGQGFSVNQVIEAARRVTGRTIPSVVIGRRAGDPAALVASSGRAKHVLGWKPQYAELDVMVRDAWQWHQAHPQGYAD